MHVKKVIKFYMFVRKLTAVKEFASLNILKFCRGVELRWHEVMELIGLKWNNAGRNFSVIWFRQIIHEFILMFVIVMWSSWEIFQLLIWKISFKELFWCELMRLEFYSWSIFTSLLSHCSQNKQHQT